jgi:hypothetical protein
MKIDLYRAMYLENPVLFLRQEEEKIFEEYPLLKELSIVEEINGIRHKNNWKHTLGVLQKMCDKTSDPVMRFIALFHDIGKVKCKRFDRDRGWQFVGHPRWGANYAKSYVEKLGYLTTNDIEKIYTVIDLHQYPVELCMQFSEITDSALRRFAVNCGKYLDDILAFCECDITTANKEKEKRYYYVLENLIIKRTYDILKKDEKDKWRPSFNGNDLMNLGAKPGRSLGEIKDKIIIAIKKGKIIDTKEECLKYALELIRGN